MKFIFRPRTQGDAHQIVGWHYLPPYDFYDLDQDPEDLAEFLDPRTWQEPHYSVFDEAGKLVVFLTSGQMVKESRSDWVCDQI